MPKYNPDRSNAPWAETDERDYLQGLPADAELPSYFSRDENGQVGRAGNIFQRHSWLGPATFAGGAIAAPYIAGALGGGGGTASTAATPASGGIESTGGVMSGLPGAGTSLSGSSGGSVGIKSTLGSIFGGGRNGSKGLDPTSLLLAALSMFGGPQQRQSFDDPGHMTDPKQALQESLNGIYRMGQGVTEMSPVKLRSSYVQAPPAPVTIPGLPFQIGGGLGRDPALDNPALLEGAGSNPFKYDPFQSLSSAGANGSKAKLRTP